MKSDHPILTLLGSNSGNNAGDAGILASILDAISKELPDAEFLVPSTNPRFIDGNYAEKYRVKGINVMPWTASVRLFGIPTMRCMAKSDLALITDGIIFDVKLFNPTFNFLITLIFLVPWAKLVNCKLICYSCGVGPLETFWGRRFARWVINACDLVIMREHDSKRLCEEVGVTQPIEVTGDAAFLNVVSNEERCDEILAAENISLDRPALGINVTRYVDQWLKPGEKITDRGAYLHMLADGIEQARQQADQAFDVILFSTHPMDLEFCEKLAQLVDGRVVSSTKYLSHDLQAVMRRCELFMGMRFHSVVFASAVGVPIVGLVYAPKVRGFMRLLDSEKYGLELAELSDKLLAQRLAHAWNERHALAAQQKLVIDELKAGARRAAVTLRERYFTPSSQSTCSVAA